MRLKLSKKQFTATLLFFKYVEECRRRSCLSGHSRILINFKKQRKVKRILLNLTHVRLSSSLVLLFLATIQGMVVWFNQLRKIRKLCTTLTLSQNLQIGFKRGPTPWTWFEILRHHRSCQYIAYRFVLAWLLLGIQFGPLLLSAGTRCLPARFGCEPGTLCFVSH